MKIVDLSPSHATIAARLHIAGQPGTFLTSLGPGVLTALYRALPQSAVGFGFAACIDVPFASTPNSHLPMSDTPVGFVAATTSTGGLFFELGTRHLHQFLPPLLQRLLRRPALLPQLAQTVFYPFLHGENGDNFTATSEKSGDNAGDKRDNSPQAKGLAAELLSIMVDPSWRGQGIGTTLLQRLIQECETRELTVLDVTVDAQNAGARHFYEAHGFVEQYPFLLYGRAMYSYRRHLPVAAAASHQATTVEVVP